MADVETVLKKLRAFRDERDWMQFHNPKDMAAALAIEASELQELFLWKTREESERVVVEKRERLEEELADIANYLFELADNLGINLLEAMEAKIEKNARKYPADKARGNAQKYTEL